MKILIALATPAVLAGTLMLAGCSASNNDSSSPSSAAGERPAPADNGLEMGAPEGDSLSSQAQRQRDTAATSVKGRPPAQTAAIISKGTVSLKEPDVQKARFALDALVTSHQGQITDEKTATGKDGEVTNSRMTVRVPSGEFDDVMAAVEKLGTLVSSTSSSEDVTTQVIDIDVRVRAQEKSLERIEALLSQARSLNEIIRIESELTRRQADLDSLKQQQAWLADQTSLSTITVFMEKQDAAAPPPAKKTHHNPFVAGIIRGWHGLGVATGWLARGVGLVLPFVLPITLLGLPLWWLVRVIGRRFAHRRSTGEVEVA
ncbi:MAG TPA: DUF4349 domain-containing protein [Nocardioides sp.]|jgi:hypothetical protein